MNQRLSWIAWGLLSLGAAGCQCCGLTECYQDKIDCIADHTLCLDRCYHATWDLTRIGYPDWCAGPINHWCYGDCCRCCRQPPPYDHMPIYVPELQAAGRLPNRIPAVPPVDPDNLIPPSDLVGPSPTPSPEQLNQPSLVPNPPELNLTPPEFPPAAQPPAFPPPQPNPGPGAVRDHLFVPASHSVPKFETLPEPPGELPDPSLAPAFPSATELRSATYEWVPKPKSPASRNEPAASR